jgi:hypothetical protein
MPPGYYATMGRLGINLLLLVIVAQAAPYRTFSTLCKPVQKAAITSMNWEIFWFYWGEIAKSFNNLQVVPKIFAACAQLWPAGSTQGCRITFPIAFRPASTFNASAVCASGKV